MIQKSTLAKSVAFAFALSSALPSISFAKDPLPVVATFSILGDMVEQVGGQHVSVTTLVGHDGDAHVYQPTPKDASAVSSAKVLFVNGLEFEGWMERLVGASNFSGLQVVATDGIAAIPFEEEGHHDEHEGHDDHDDHGHDEHKHDEHAHDEHGHDEHKHDEHAHDEHGHDEHKHDEHAHDEHGHDEHKHDEHAHDEHGHHEHQGHNHGTFDPHAWQSASLAITYVNNIAAGLSKADPDNASDYEANRASYVAKLEALDADIKKRVAALPENARTVVTPHDAFGYYAASYGLKFIAPVGLSTESEASAADVAALIKQIRKDNISAVFVESITDNRLIDQIARETGAKVGGTLYSDALGGPDSPASTYLDMMNHNTSTILDAIGQ